jgi:hypothetical protein
MTKDKGNLFRLTEIREPVPGEHALAGDDEAVAEGPDGGEKVIGRRRDRGLNDDVAGLVEHAQGQSSGV